MKLIRYFLPYVLMSCIGSSVSAQKIVGGKIVDLVMQRIASGPYYSLKCMDIDPTTSDRVYGGYIYDHTILATTFPTPSTAVQNWVLPLLGMKTSSMDMADNKDWNWLYVFEPMISRNIAFVQTCHWTPMAVGAPYNKKLIVALIACQPKNYDYKITYYQIHLPKPLGNELTGR